MSSHHFVKEDQEPALLILKAKAISFEKVQELLEWSPTVIVSEQALQEVLGWGIKIDRLLCTEEKLNLFNQSLIEQSPIRFISYCNENEALSTAYCFLAAAKYKAVNILISDLSQLNFIQSFTGMDVEVFYEGRRWVYINSRKFEKWVSANTQFYTYPDLALIQITQTGLNKELKCLKDGVVSIEGTTSFWLGENLES
jgi:thiamine pyrophosphokinase